jgi:hypothetical protein
MALALAAFQADCKDGDSVETSAFQAIAKQAHQRDVYNG